MYFFCPPQLLFCRKHEMSSFFNPISDQRSVETSGFPSDGCYELHLAQDVAVISDFKPERSNEEGAI